MLHIIPAKAAPNAQKSMEPSTAGFKAVKEQKLKESASSDRNWNSLFIRDSTVAEAAARELNMEKGTLKIS